MSDTITVIFWYVIVGVFAFFMGAAYGSKDEAARACKYKRWYTDLADNAKDIWQGMDFVNECVIQKENGDLYANYKAIQLAKEGEVRGAFMISLATLQGLLGMRSGRIFLGGDDENTPSLEDRVDGAELPWQSSADIVNPHGSGEPSRGRDIPEGKLLEYDKETGRTVVEFYQEPGAGNP